LLALDVTAWHCAFPSLYNNASAERIIQTASLPLKGRPVIGRLRLPTFADFPHLPYIRAMVKESLCRRLIVPSGVPHQTTEDDRYEGMFIPKGHDLYYKRMTHEPGPRDLWRSALMPSVGLARSGLRPAHERLGPNRWYRARRILKISQLLSETRMLGAKPTHRV
jgi:hypothetical protein